MRIIGIDPGLNITGFGLIEHNKNSVKLIIAGVVKTSPKQPIQNRLNKIHSDILEILLKYKPEVLVLEKLYAHYKYPTIAISLGYARGAVSLAGAQAHIPIKDYSSKRIKKAITGRGGASKEQVQRMVQGLLNLKETPNPYDISDALALALGYIHLNRKEVISNDFKS